MDRYMEDVGYVVTEKQQQLLDSIDKNINDGRKMQSIILPNAGGKTTLGLILAIKYTYERKRVLFYSYNAIHMSNYALHAIRAPREKFKGITFSDDKHISKIANEEYDVVIIDSAYACISFDVLTSAEKWNRLIEHAIEQRKFGAETMSEAQNAALGLNYLSDIIRNSNSYVIDFELHELPEMEFVPVITGSNFITCKMSEAEVSEYEAAVADSMEQIAKSKLELAKSDKLVNEKIVKKYESYIRVLDQKIIALTDMVQSGFTSVDGKLDNIQHDISQILDIVTELNTITKDSKSTLKTYFSIHDNDDDDEAEAFVTKIVDKMSAEMMKKTELICNQEKYLATNRLVMVRMGNDAWNKLEEESKKFLVTAKFLFNENMNLGDCIDYSSICLLASKAFEVELAKRFLAFYEEYIESHVGRNLEKWPSALIKTYKKRGELVKEILTVEDFTLGSCPYILGIYGNYNEKTTNHDWFVKYCQSKLLKEKANKEIEKILIDCNEYIKTVKDLYRNPAAHKETMTVVEASDCLDYILEITRVLKLMLEQFSF